MINVLVTGAGGGVGQGIIKSLKMIFDMDINVIAADMSENATGLYAADKSYLVEGCKSAGYMDSLEIIFNSESINYYFPGTDIELEFCAENRDTILKKYNVKTVVSPLNAVQISDDKYETYLFLKKNGFSHPKTIWLKDILSSNRIDYPLIVKPAVGCRSIGVYKVNNDSELSQYTPESDGILAQELVGNDNSEYTCTVVRVDGMLSPVLALRRVLRSGDTYRAEPIKSNIIEEYVSSVATKLDIEGACNFQLRMDSMGTPKIFEINCRYSGTTPFCSQLGFNPVEYYLKKDLKISYSPKIDYNSIALRYWMEVIVNKESMATLKKERTIMPDLQQQFNLF